MRGTLSTQAPTAAGCIFFSRARTIIQALLLSSSVIPSYGSLSLPVLKPLDFITGGPRTVLFLRALFCDLLGRPTLLRKLEDVAVVFSRLAARLFLSSYVNSCCDRVSVILCCFCLRHLPVCTTWFCSTFCRLGAASADRSLLRDGIEIFVKQHVSLASLLTVMEAANGQGDMSSSLQLADPKLRLKAARRALSSVHAEDGGDVFEDAHASRRVECDT